MRLSGRRLTLVLTTLFVVVLAAGATAAWSFGLHRAEPLASVAAYQSGPTDDQSVRLSTEAGVHPRAADVQMLLQHYFDSINNRDYESWVGAVATAQSAPQSEDQWQQDYASTVDSNLTVMIIKDEPLRARMMFTSEQSVELAPTSLPVTCINWDMTYLLNDQDGQLVLSGIDPSTQSMTACA
jgi:hypothetical protein